MIWVHEMIHRHVVEAVHAEEEEGVDVDGVVGIVGVHQDWGPLKVFTSMMFKKRYYWNL